jgi:light-regulated signal transduction histidine kinase (bacteriophytochrome)
MQQISPCEIVRIALLNLQAAIDESQASVEINISDCPDVIADQSQIIRVFQNIIGNSIKYRRSGFPPRIQIECSDLGGMVEFRIGDNGIGISPEFYDRIFGLFQRLHTRQAIEGNGIGLAVCKKIIERHRGNIFVEAVPGSGATFKFTLVKAGTPLANELSPTAPPQQPASSGR